jgi:hypothetical protein
MTIPGRLLVCACLLLTGHPACCADEPILLQRSGPATLRTMSPLVNGGLALAFTDVLRLIIEVEGGAELEVRAPEAWAKGPWQARAAAAVDRKESGQKVIWSQALELEPLQPGELSLTLEPLRYRDGGGQWQTVTWNAIAAQVTSRLKQPDLKNARDITAIEQLPPRLPPKKQIELIVMIAVGIPLAVLLLSIFLHRRRTARVRQSAEAWACYELKRLQALHLPEQGKHERFGTLLTGLMRRYLAKRYDLPVRRQTTGEFLAALAGHAELAAHGPFLQAFLQRCDLLKFAPVTTTVDECRALAEQVSRFITQHEQPATSQSAGAP